VSIEPDVSRRRVALLILAVLLVVSACVQPTVAQGGVDVRIAAGEPFTWDPARAGDSGSANVIAQVFEGLTTFDLNNKVQPALAESWQTADDGRQITFHLRPGNRFSDGSPITAQDVVDSWLRLIDPAQPSPLFSLLADIAGALEYVSGQGSREGVGLRADGDNVVVDLRRPATYFLSVTGSPSLAVVPRSMYGQLESSVPANVVVSGAYVPSLTGPGSIRLTGNPNYWAGTPPLDVVELVSDFGGANSVDAFEAGTVDFVPVSGFDASWIKYHRELGPQLRQDSDFQLTYYGFNTTVEPFDDPDVRLAFAKAVDWNRIVTLGGGQPATSMVPVGIPGRDSADHRPTYDVEAARELLSDAGFPGGEGMPAVTLMTYGAGSETTVAAELETNLGVQLNVEAIDFRDFDARIAGAGAPGIWTLAWSADYPHPHDFLGLLLESGSSNNTGSWSNPQYDALIEQAAASADVDEQARIYAQAEDILAQEAPVVPFSYGESWSLAREGLLGADTTGVGIVRIAGMDWAAGSGR
jgi:oligopeptide transport system substrate-binding protein